MDEEWALTQLRGFIELTHLVQPQSEGGVVFMGDFASPAESKANIVAASNPKREPRAEPDVQLGCSPTGVFTHEA